MYGNAWMSIVRGEGRLGTGVRGLDALMNGGYPRRSTILVSGYPGTGKTLLASHFLGSGMEDGSNGIYVGVDSKEEFFSQSEMFGFSFREYEEKGAFKYLRAIPKMFFTSPSSFDMQNTIEGIEEARALVNAERLVIDSISALMVVFETGYQARRNLYLLNSRLKELGLTSIFVSEVGTMGFSSFGVEEYMADGVVSLSLDEVQVGRFQRFLRVVKMRKTTHKMERYPVQIGSDGMEVLRKA